MQCYKCFNEFDYPDFMLDGSPAKILCGDCHKIAVEEMKERLSHSEEVGQLSSPISFEEKELHSRETGAYTGVGKTAGGGRRVIKETKTQS